MTVRDGAEAELVLCSFRAIMPTHLAESRVQNGKVRFFRGNFRLLKVLLELGEAVVLGQHVNPLNVAVVDLLILRTVVVVAITFLGRFLFFFLFVILVELAAGRELQMLKSGVVVCQAALIIRNLLQEVCIFEHELEPVGLLGVSSFTLLLLDERDDTAALVFLLLLTQVHGHEQQRR